MTAANRDRTRAVVFDLDGTLADTSADLIAAANESLAALGHGARLGPGDAATAFQGGRAMLRLGLARAGQGAGPLAEAQVEAGYPRLLAAYAGAICVETRLYPGAAEAVAALRGAGFATAVCTNKPEALAEALLARLGVRGLFGALVGADTLPVRKPDPAPYCLAVDRAGGRVAASALVGDTETDVATARAAGVPVALVSFGPEGEGVARWAPDAMLVHYGSLGTIAERLVPRPKRVAGR
jgi:phosphoglycolate phosphatase